MRIVVFSDSHRNYNALQAVVIAQPGAELFLFLGDGEAEFQVLRQRFPDKWMLGVAGNNDWGSTEEKRRVVTCADKRIFLTHGHLYRGIDGVAGAATALEADVALYGHSHVAHIEYRNGLYLMNPGSVARPRQGPASYGFIDITPAGIVTKIVAMERGRR